MKKVGLLIKPYLCIIFGALLFLIYLNLLAGEGSALALGIIGVVLSAIYLGIGIVEVLLGDKLNKTAKLVFDVCVISLFPLFMFVNYILTVINMADLEGGVGPTAWTIAIISMVGSLGLAVIAPITKFVKNKVLSRISFLFAAIFVLVLLLNILFDYDGTPATLGGVSIIILVLYVVFSIMLFNSFEPQDDEKERAQEDN